jgi:hypothetical protein
LRAEQVGHAHRAQLRAVEAVGRKRDRHAQHGAPDAVLAEDGPERLRLAQQPNLGAMTRDQIATELEEAIDLADVRRRENGQVGAAVAIEEVEDVVPSGMDAGAERRPRNRRDRRIGRLQPPVAAHLRELREVGQEAFLHEPIGERRILAVEADEDQPFDRGAGRPLSPREPPERAERPDEDRRDRDHDRREDDEERSQNGEAGAGSDVRVGPTGQDQQDQRHQREA